VEGLEKMYRDHFVEQNAQCPPVDRLGVTLTDQELGSQVFWCTAKRVGLFAIGHVELAKTEITQRNVPVAIEQDVFRFQVAVGRGGGGRGEGIKRFEICLARVFLKIQYR